MQRERIIELAKQAGVMVHFDSKFGREEYQNVCSSYPAFERFASLIEAETIEQCAAAAVEWGNARKDNHGGHALRNYAEHIRSLK